MSDRKIDIDLTKNTEVNANQVPTPEELKNFEGRIAQVLDRTITIDRTNVLLPGHLDGYWCPNDSVSEAQARLRGFEIDNEYAKRNGLNDQADGKTIVGDVFHMIRPMWMKNAEDKAKANRYHDMHLRDRRKQKEEKDFLAANPLESKVTSEVENITGPQIEEALSPKG